MARDAEPRLRQSRPRPGRPHALRYRGLPDGSRLAAGGRGLGARAPPSRRALGHARPGTAGSPCSRATMAGGQGAAGLDVAGIVHAADRAARRPSTCRPPAGASALPQARARPGSGPRPSRSWSGRTGRRRWSSSSPRAARRSARRCRSAGGGGCSGPWRASRPCGRPAPPGAGLRRVAGVCFRPASTPSVQAYCFSAPPPHRSLSTGWPASTRADPSS